MGSVSRRAAALPPEERREALIAATLPLVLEHGTDVSTRLIAEAAGVAEGTIFRVFPSKNDLIEAVVASAFDPSSLVEAIAAIEPDLPLADRPAAAVLLTPARRGRAAGGWPAWRTPSRSTARCPARSTRGASARPRAGSSTHSRSSCCPTGTS